MSVDEGSCPLCEGRGWVVVDDGGAGAAKRCECARKAAGPRLLAATGIPERYLKCRLENFKVANPEPSQRDALLRARTVAEHYVDSFLELDGKFREAGLIFIGPPGVGKTHLAVGVLTEVVRRYGRHGRFVDFTSLLHELQATFGSSEGVTKSDLLDPICSAEILVLDELGAQKPSPWVGEILYLILNTRYGRRLPTLFTTNYRLEKVGGERDALPSGAEMLASRIPAMLVSRLFEMAQPVLLESGDYRREVMMHQHRI